MVRGVKVVAIYLRTWGLVTFHPNVHKLGKAGNSDMLFHVMNHFFVI